MASNVTMDVVLEEEEDNTFYIYFSVCLAFFTMVEISIVWMICYTFRKTPKHRNYLLFFGFTMVGILLVLTDRVTGAWITKWNPFWNWIFYVLGQNLLVTPELIRAGRLVILYYGSVSVFPPGRILPANVRASYLTTSWMVAMLVLLQLPAMAFYVALGISRNIIFDYLCVTYFSIQLLLLIIAVVLLFLKREELKRYQLAETGTLSALAFTLLFYIVFENIRFYGFAENQDGDVLLLWDILDVFTLTMYCILVSGIWIKHIWIMWQRDNGTGFSNTTSDWSGPQSTMKSVTSLTSHTVAPDIEIRRLREVLDHLEDEHRTLSLALTSMKGLKNSYFKTIIECEDIVPVGLAESVNLDITRLSSKLDRLLTMNTKLAASLMMVGNPHLNTDLDFVDQNVKPTEENSDEPTTESQGFS